MPRLADKVVELKLDKIFIITDQIIVKLGLMKELFSLLDARNIAYTVYDKTVPNPTIDNIEEAAKSYKATGGQGLIAFGGGSAIDCAKGVGARLVQPEKTFAQMKGQLKVGRKLPPFFAVPTTAGTGSEATIAAVITDPTTHEKYAVNDMVLVPEYAVLDPVLTLGLPPSITSTTGMDALTHGIEAYIGRGNTQETKKLSLQAIKLIMDNLTKAYHQGDDIQARASLQKASYLAGAAFTRAYIGYVHAMAHTLGGFYSIPHGLANSIILPHVLDFYGSSVHKKLAELAEVSGLGEEGDSISLKALKFIEKIKAMNQEMNIPEFVEGIREADIPLMVARAASEANPLYPVPRILSKKEIEVLFRKVMKPRGGQE